MENVLEKIKNITAEFIENVSEAFGNNLRSVILYGPAARGETLKKVPYINFMVVLEDNTPSELAHCSKYLKKWRKHLIATPLFLDTGYIGRSLDTFPLEFLDMSSAYEVIHGEDVLEDITFGDEDVRNQCERELKGKLLHLRAEYLNLRENKKALIDLVDRSLNTFRMLFIGALFLKDIEVPSDTDKLLSLVTKEYELDSSLLIKLRNIAKGEIKVDESEADGLFDLYVEELDKLSNALDKMTDVPDRPVE
ncbi:hypothetical protein ACFL2X_00200 [Candidatus Latescibacterota bacterium]